jgi:Flp pilus assembly protein TadD
VLCAIAVGLALATAWVYRDLPGHPFVRLDDPEYVIENDFVRPGVTWGGIRAAFAGVHASNWHPLTWLSHMVDCTMFGTWAGGHLSVNLGLHAANAVLLLAWLVRETGARWRAVLVAALFAVHPIQVESVAWVSQRKTLLAALFFLLALRAYSARRHRLVILWFVLGLMSKQMVVTLPFLLLVVDFWPAARREEGWRALVFEKRALFLLAALGCVAAVVAQWSTAVAPLETFPAPARLANALTAYTSYMAKAIWPAELSVFYPHPRGRLTDGAVAASAALLAALTAAAAAAAATARAGHRPLIAGWLWFLGTLVPVIGLVQVAGQAMADRYAYLPAIGLWIAIAWGLGDLANRSSSLVRHGLTIGAATWIVLLAARTDARVRLWRSTVALVEQAHEVTGPDPWVLALLGHSLVQEGRIDEGVRRYRQALALQRSSAPIHNGMGVALLRLGRTDEARPHLEEAIRLDPGQADAQTNRAVLDLALGRPELARDRLIRLVVRFPAHAPAHDALGTATARLRQPRQAVAHFRRAVEIRPYDVRLLANLGKALLDAARPDEAVGPLEAAAAIDPENPDVRRNLALARRKGASVGGGAPSPAPSIDPERVPR